MPVDRDASPEPARTALGDGNPPPLADGVQLCDVRQHRLERDGVEVDETPLEIRAADSAVPGVAPESQSVRNERNAAAADQRRYGVYP